MNWQYTLSDLAGMVDATASVGNAVFKRVSTDTRKIEPGDLFVALRGGNFDGEVFVAEAFRKGAAGALCREPHPEGICVLTPDPLAAFQAFAAQHRRRFDIPVLAITGSCGKTTSKDMAASVLATRFLVTKTEGNLNNEIGLPHSLMRLGPETEFAVIEMGANHMGEISALCRIAAPTESAVTMVAPAHLEGFGSVENVARAKAEIVESLAADGCFYVNADNPWCARMGEAYPGEKVYFGRTGDVVLRSCSFDASSELVLDVSPVGKIRLPLLIRAHATNVLLAIAVGLRHGIDEFEGPLRQACARAARFKVLEVGGLTVLDDSYNANPASMAAALEALADRPGCAARFAALGEMLELGDAAAELHREVGRAAGRCGVDVLYARGPHAADMAAGAREAGVRVAEVVEEHGEIAARVRGAARPGDLLLVKGSRGMQMEKVITALQATAANRPEEDKLQ